MQRDSSSRRNRNRHEDEDHAPPMAHDESNWLVSYADLMTLLFGFFVLMYTFSKVDKDRFEVVSRDLVKYFGGKMTDPAFPSDAFKARSEQLTTELRQMGLEIEASQQNGASSLTLTLGTDVLFSPGSAQLTPQAMAAAQKLAQTLLKVNVDKIEVEGHTDSDPIRSALYPSNWELSTARAASLVRALEYMKVPRQHLKAAGYADTLPLVPEKGESGESLVDNKKKNRRLVLQISASRQQPGLEAALQKAGLQRMPTAHQPTPSLTEKTAEQSMQQRYDEIQQRLEEAQQRLQVEKDRQNRLRDLEKLAKKAEEAERKLQETQQKTQEVLEKTRGMMNNE